jgi:hypothetical protein
MSNLDFTLLAVKGFNTDLTQLCGLQEAPGDTAAKVPQNKG